MIKNLLATCGLNESERTVLLYLLEHGQTIASIIAKMTGLKRPTAYAVLDSLINSGLVMKQKRGIVTYYSAVSPDMIPKIFENQAKKTFNEITSASRLLSDQLPEILKKEEHDIGGFKIQTVESVESMYVLLEDALLSGDFYSIFNPQLIFGSKELNDLTLNYLKTTSVSKPTIREILVEGPKADWYISNINNPNHKIKEIPEDKKIISDIFIANESVVLFHYNPKNEIGIKIEHKDFYKTMITVFEMLWKSL